GVLVSYDELPIGRLPVHGGSDQREVCAAKSTGLDADDHISRPGKRCWHLPYLQAVWANKHHCSHLCGNAHCVPPFEDSSLIIRYNSFSMSIRCSCMTFPA